MLVLIAVFTALSFLMCCGEAYYDRGWPRDMFKYFVAMASLLAFWLLFVN